MRDNYAGNRSTLLKKLQGSVVVIRAYSDMQRANDCAHKFSQYANFRYLTGIEDPDYLLVMDASTGKEWLVQPDHDDIHEVFNGSATVDHLREVSGIHDIVKHDELEPLLKRLSAKHTVVYSTKQPEWLERMNFITNPALKKNTQMLERIFSKVLFCDDVLNQMRAKKQPYEIEAIRRAISITSNAFESAYSQLSTYKYEYEIEADFTHAFISKGTEGHAYDPIVAAGNNACTLHYIKNRDKLQNRQLVLLDIGAQVNGYAADLTRTYARGRVTKRQIAVHAAVEAAQKQIISLLAPGVSVEQYHKDVDAIMIEALKSLDLIGADEQASLRKYMPHAVSHGLGLDVHDSLGAPKFFESTMVLTVEPGIYIPEEGIGVRIEDDILITADGYDNLSGKLPTTL